MPPSTKKRLIAAVFLMSLLAFTYSTIASANYYKMHLESLRGEDIKITVSDNDFVVVEPFIRSDNGTRVFLPHPFLITQETPLVLPLGIGVYLRGMNNPDNVHIEYEEVLNYTLKGITPTHEIATSEQTLDPVDPENFRLVMFIRDQGIQRMLTILGGEQAENRETCEPLLREINRLGMLPRTINTITPTGEQISPSVFNRAYNILDSEPPTSNPLEITEANTSTYSVPPTDSPQWFPCSFTGTFSHVLQLIQHQDGTYPTYAIARIRNANQPIPVYYLLLFPGDILPESFQDIQIEILVFNHPGSDNVNIVRIFLKYSPLSRPIFN
jgi:hypothetical protein